MGRGFTPASRPCVPENVTLIQLPAYSPELNPFENLWRYGFRDQEFFTLKILGIHETKCVFDG